MAKQSQFNPRVEIPPTTQPTNTTDQVAAPPNTPPVNYRSEFDSTRLMYGLVSRFGKSKT